MKHDSKQIYNFVYKSCEKTTTSNFIQKQNRNYWNELHPYVSSKMLNSLRNAFDFHVFWLNYTLIFCLEFIESKRRFWTYLIFDIQNKRSNRNIHSQNRSHWCSCEFYASMIEAFMCKWPEVVQIKDRLK